jgi:hypothetical protein
MKVQIWLELLLFFDVQSMEEHYITTDLPLGFVTLSAFHFTCGSNSDAAWI